MNSWINANIELPPCDGLYWCSNDMIHVEIFYYNGIAFVLGGICKYVDYWKNVPQVRKRYGKIE